MKHRRAPTANTAASRRPGVEAMREKRGDRGVASSYKRNPAKYNKIAILTNQFPQTSKCKQ
jgi:hypothetical protein